MTHGRFIFTFAAMMACACYVYGGIGEDRNAAMKLRNDGNVREAYEAYAKLALNPQNTGANAVMDFNQAVNCLQQLNRIGEFDDFLKKVLDVRKDDWRFVSGYHYPMNQGYIIDGKFTRGWNRGGQARFIDVRFADTLSQIKLMVKNMPPVTEEGADQFYMRLADIFANSANMGYSKAGLNILMDITQEPDYLNPHVNGSITNGTPVDADGNPVFFRCPKSFEDAKNDGERAVWAYREAMKCNYDKYAGIRAIIKLAYFYMPLYGVETLTNRGYSRSPNNDKALRNNILLLEKLEDDETIAQLATGIKRFKVPDECNPILLWKQAVEMEEYLKYF